jgi:hypothetical protein
MKREELAKFKEDDCVMACFTDLIQERLPPGDEIRDHFSDEQLQLLFEQAVAVIYPRYFEESE